MIGKDLKGHDFSMAEEEAVYEEDLKSNNDLLMSICFCPHHRVCHFVMRSPFSNKGHT